MILYADDDNDDKAWISEACSALNYSFSFQFVNNGRQALDYLSTLASAHLPALIVLDLNMPEMVGRLTLQQLKSNPSYQHIPVAIVTTSSSKIDRDVCHRLGAAIYLTKPDNHLEWQNVVRQLENLVSKTASISS
ncbi:MAG: response regulator [Flavisolibacter sp.]|nr:response regulator [Flavisolibacter sp.]